MFGQQARLRRTATRVLLVWLFALTSSVANACVMEPGLRHAPLATTDSHHPAPPTHPHEHCARAPGHDHPQTPSGKAPCAKCCDEESARRTDRQEADRLLSAVWLAPPPYVSGPVQTLRGPVRAFNAEHWHVHARVPIPIAFLRLTL